MYELACHYMLISKSQDFTVIRYVKVDKFPFWIWIEYILGAMQ